MNKFKLLKAEIYFLSTNKGGCKHDLIPAAGMSHSSWANTTDKDGNAWSIGLFFDAETIIRPGTTHIVGVAFICGEAYNHYAAGDEVQFCEGDKLIAIGKIL